MVQARLTLLFLKGTLKSVGVQINVLILTDEAKSTRDMAGRLAGGIKHAAVKIVSAVAFTGTDILLADCCFFGCEEPNPPEFTYLEKLLRHINLAGRHCGVFSPKSSAAVEYLSNMVHDCEIDLDPRLLVGGDPGAIQAWAAGIYQLNVRWKS
jgi:hypothetical protein